jgi:AcrR family transcriptional regulator
MARLNSAQRRESILHAATEVFASSGYHAARMSDIAARVGVTEPVIFQNFGTKAALYAAVLSHAAEGMRSALAGYGSAAELLAHVLSHPGGSAPLFADAIRNANSPELAEVRDRTLRALADHLADIVIQGHNDGSLRPDVDPQAAAWFILSILVTRPLRAAAGASVEPSVTDLALGALTPPD